MCVRYTVHCHRARVLLEKPILILFGSEFYLFNFYFGRPTMSTLAGVCIVRLMVSSVVAIQYITEQVKFHLQPSLTRHSLRRAYRFRPTVLRH
jgi:hypothetical protein